MTAREGDFVLCAKHGFTFIQPPDREVLVNGAKIAAVSDPCPCTWMMNPNLTAPQFDVDNKLMSGMSEVLVGGKPVAAMGLATMHNLGSPTAPDGVVAMGSFDVFVGGNRVVGDVDAAKEACMNAAATRGNATDGRAKTLQSFENCGCESMRQLANGKKKPGDPGFVTEEEFFYDQVVKGNAEVPLTDAEVAQMNKRCEPLMKAAGDAHAAADPFNPTPEQLARIEEADRAVADCTGKFKADIARKNAKRRAMSGGTNLKTRDAMSKGTPYETEQKLPDIPTALEGVGTGKGVVMPMNGMPMANGKTTGGHIVVITGVVVDDDGNPVSVIYNDSFNGCAVTMPAGDFDAKIQKDGATNITKKPVW